MLLRNALTAAIDSMYPTPGRQELVRLTGALAHRLLGVAAPVGNAGAQNGLEGLKVLAKEAEQHAASRIFDAGMDAPGNGHDEQEGGNLCHVVAVSNLSVKNGFYTLTCKTSRVQGHACLPSKCPDNDNLCRVRKRTPGYRESPP